MLKAKNTERQCIKCGKITTLLDVHFWTFPYKERFTLCCLCFHDKLSIKVDKFATESTEIVRAWFNGTPVDTLNFRPGRIDVYPKLVTEEVEDDEVEDDEMRRELKILEEKLYGKAEEDDSDGTDGATGEDPGADVGDDDDGDGELQGNA